MLQQILLLLLLKTTLSNILTLNWNITYLNNIDPTNSNNPRRVVTVNNIWPIPPVFATIGQVLVINVLNLLDVPTAVHSHGLFQRGSGEYDGAVGITQCPIPPNTYFTYSIPLNQTGTYWIHAHLLGQYVDGFRLPLIIKPLLNQTFIELPITLTDWYFTEHPVLMKSFLSIYNPFGIEPVPDAGLINEGINRVFQFIPGKTYRIRLINMSAFAMFTFQIDNHDLEIIEVDGVDTVPYKVSLLTISAAQRFSILVVAKNSTDLNYLMHVDMDPSMFNVVPPTLNLSNFSII